MDPEITGGEVGNRRVHMIGSARIAIATVAAAFAVAASSALLAPPTVVAGVQVPKLRWTQCPDDADLQCAGARVPLDYRHPRGAKIRLALARHRAGDPERRVGTLFFNPGGPAAAKPMFPAIVRFLPREMEQRFDVITWDPRGHGDSTAVECFRSGAAEEEFLAGVGVSDGRTFPVGADQFSLWSERYAAFGRHCKRRSGALMRHMSTADSARDMNLLRRSVGERRLTYYGGSYGTFLGSTYANLFPERVRAMILDGVANPVKWVSRGRRARQAATRRPTFVRQHSDVGSRETLNAFLDLCGGFSTDGCAFSAGSAAATREKFAALLERLPAEPSDAGPSYAEFVSSVINGIYVSLVWDRVAQSMQELWETGSTKLRARPWGAPLFSQPALERKADTQYVSVGQTLGTICGESPNPGPSAFPAADAFATDRSGPVGGYWTWITEACAAWPVKAANRYAGPWNRRTATPVLVISNKVDPATPYPSAVAVSRTLGRARLLTVDAYGHTVFANPSACAHKHIGRYLIRRTLPRPGAQCAGLRPFVDKP